MGNNEFEFMKFKKKTSLLPIIITGIVLLLLLFLLRNCNSPNRFWNGVSPDYSFNNPFPDKPGKVTPIDSAKIIISPDDPLKRRRISDLLNVYVQDTVNLKIFSKNVINAYIQDSLKVVMYREEYKRVQFRVPAKRQKELKEQMKKDFKSVKFICYESVISQHQSKIDPGFKNPDYDWFYRQIGLYNAWNVTMGSSDIKIAVIDDSFDATHKELVHQIEKSWNVFEYTNVLNTYGKLVHGTHVSGIVAGEIDNGFGISGVAPKCKIIPIQIADISGQMTTSSILDGIFYALKNDADVINMSLGVNIPNVLRDLPEEEQEAYAETILQDEAEMWNEVYEIAEKDGVVIVQAAGNSSVVASLDPMKRSKTSIIVGATNRNGKIAKFSNYGNSVDIYAPGVGIYSSFPNQQFKSLDGTSMASPIIAGCVALIKSVNKNISTQQIKAIINETGKDIGNNEKLIQIDKVLSKIKNL